MSSQVVTPQSTQYAMKKRKRPKPRSKNAAQEAPVKSNPSKRHRDRLNTELDRLSQLIPLPPDVVNKLDKLSILRLSVAYLRNKSYSKHVGDNDNPAILPSARNQQVPSAEMSESELALQALDGFIMVVTQDFNVFYITPNVQDCLGFPQSDVMYQSMLDLIHAEDRKLFMKQMMLNPKGDEPEDPPEDGDFPVVPDYIKHGLTPDVVKQWSQDGLLHRSFICRLRCLHDTSSGFLALHFTGHLSLVPGQNRHSENGTLLPPELGLFLMASPLQTPSILEIRTKNYIFRTKHKLDYTPLGIDQKGRIVLGYTEHELRQQSGYQFIHSADMMHCADAHTKLMRKGESGLTVFRLLHRANRWQWVTASARLIFNKGVPEYIISTHRPITEQEGEENLKKRSNAFRFDFTGHASLYASVNPIGAGPPPSNNNRSYDSSPEAKPHIQGTGPNNKRARITNGVHPGSIDPATLYGAQSFQSMDNYPEGLPIIKTNDSPLNYDEVIKAEPQNYGMGGYFKGTGGNNPGDSPLSSDVVSPDSGFTGDKSPRYNDFDSGVSDGDHRASPTYNMVLEGLMEPPPLHHPPISEIDTQQYQEYQQPQANGYAQQQQQVPMPNQYNQPRPDITAPQATNWNQQQNQPPIMRGQQYAPQQQQIPPQPRVTNGVSGSQTMPPQMYGTNQPTTVYNQPAYNQPQPQMAQNGPIQQHQYQQGQQRPMPYQSNQVQPHYQQQQGQQNGGYPVAQNQGFVGQIHNPSGYNQTRQNYQQGSKTTTGPKENVSILNSLEISSIIKQDLDDQQFKDMEAMISMLGPSNNKELNSGQFEATVQYQETTLQFDMHKIAAEYQTVNPMGVIQNYVQNNPTEAFDIATGSMPGRDPNQVPPNTPAATGDMYPGCQFDNNGMNQAGYTMQPMRNQPVAKRSYPYTQPQPGMNQPHAVMNQSQIGMNNHHSGINQPQPGIKQPHAIMNKSQPGMNQPHQIINQSQPGMNQPRPIMNQLQSRMNQSHPVMNQSQVGMNHNRPIMNQSQAGMNMPHQTLNQQRGMKMQPNMHQPIGMNQPNIKSETKTDSDLDFDLEDFISFDIPSIEGCG